MILKLQDGTDFELPGNKRQAACVLADAIRNRGKIDDDQRLSWSTFVDSVLNDAISTPDIHNLLSVTTQILLREPVEPMMVIADLFTKVQAQGLQQNILLGAIGSAAEAQDIEEGGTVPEISFNLGGGMQTVMIGKTGIGASYTKEALKYSTWDIWSLNMKSMAKALRRLKEQKAVAFLKTLGVELYNNLTPSTSMFGVTTGRGLDMAPNGSLRMDDLMHAIAHMTEEGFPPDVILVNPQFYFLFVRDPVLRSLFANVGNGEYFRPWNGVTGPQDPWSNGAMGAMGPSLGNQITRGGSPAGGEATGIAGREHGMTASPTIPSYFPWQIRVIVSPFIPFDPDTLLGDIILLSSGNVGYLLQEEEPVETQWEDKARDVLFVKFIERYNFAVAHEGQGVGVLKNVKLVDNYFNGVVQAMTMDVDSEVSPTAEIDL